MVYDKVLVSPQQLEQSVSTLAKKVTAAYQESDNIVALVLLEGAKYFAEDLLAKIDLSIDVETLKVTSYCGTTSTGTVCIEGCDGLKTKITGKNILIIDDIYDTGHTLSKVLNWLNECKPQSIKSCVLLEKEIAHDEEVAIEFLGMNVPDVFVIGYGMDHDGQYRELPFIAELSSERIESH